MPLKSYGVLAGRVLEHRAEGGADTPHFQIRAQGGGTHFRVAVNVRSQQSPPELLYFADEAFSHPQVQGLPGLADGFTTLPSQPGGLALDFIRGNLVERAAMRPLPSSKPGPDNDLADKLDHYVSRAAGDPAARLYAFGQRWGPERGVPDKVFGFTPGNGVHDIHMNQGNSGRFRRDDGVWQDGALLLHYPSTDQWVAIFLAFQSQSWHTDDQTGHTLPGTLAHGLADGDHLVRIIAALVSPAPERETVTLINTSSQDLDLTGWALLDQQGQQMPLQGTTLPAGDTIRITLRPPIQLGNRGGLVTLLNPGGLKVDGVSYTAAQAQPGGRTLTF
ncbi:MAG TPA: DUF2278 family protein [Pseudonocardiaceae bacterium]|nr:DUF2278 family protein [Pseudonocardiaceae bacterium]